MSDESPLKNMDWIDPRASFSELHVVKALLLLNRGPMGRTKLIRELNLGEASVKTLLKNLRDEGLAETSTRGHRLTDGGEEIAKQIADKISYPVELGSSDLTVGKYNSAVLVRGASSKVGTGVEERDAAIKAGAEGATTIVYEDGELLLNEERIDLPEEIKSQFDLEDGDVIIIGSASSYEKAEEGTLAAALTLL